MSNSTGGTESCFPVRLFTARKFWHQLNKLKSGTLPYTSLTQSIKLCSSITGASWFLLDSYLAELGLGVHKDLAHFALEVLAGHPDAAFAAQTFALAAGASGHHFAPASRQNAVTFQHQFVLCTWWREHRVLSIATGHIK